MPLTIKNLKSDRMINLGTIKGRMLVLAPNETKTLDGELSRFFENRIINAVSGGFISVDKPEPKKKEVEGDLNGDGVFDKKDKSLAARVLRKKTTVGKKTRHTSRDD